MAAGVKVAQAVNSTHSLIPSHFLSHSVLLFFLLPSDLVFKRLHPPHLHLLLTPFASHKQPPPSLMHAGTRTNARRERHYNHSQVVSAVLEEKKKLMAEKKMPLLFLIKDPP